ncbi:uncharacterized protein [Diadema setosum]|uniref:uncharacterized protein isoform X2 n=1 Tax=Diadema setosum TaxID=31175 RepID=UPI003B3BB1AD
MDNSIDPEDEVRKLQDLVRKLEKQNELLRSKADAIGSPTPTNNGTLPLSEANTNVNLQSNGDIKSVKNAETRTKNSVKGLLDNVKVLDIHGEDANDDTWLYTSPIKVATPEQKSVSPYDWVRQDFEHPTRDQESAKKSLLAKLDEVSRANRNSMGPNVLTLQQPQIPNNSSADPLRGIEKLETSPRSQSPPPAPTPRRERRQSNEERMGLAKLEDVTDVQILARMQEESLRQATQISPANSPRRISVSPASSENALHRSASRSSSVSSTEGKSEDGDDGGKSNVVRRRPSFERIRKAGEGGRRDGMYRNNMDYRPEEYEEWDYSRPVIGRRLSQEKVRRSSGEGNERKDVSPRGTADGRNGDARTNSMQRIRGYEVDGLKVNGLHRRHSEARNGEYKAPPKALIRRSPSLDTPQRTQSAGSPSRLGRYGGSPKKRVQGDPRRYSYSPGARLGYDRMLSNEEDENEEEEALDFMSELQRPTNFMAEKQPGHRGSMPNLNRTFVVQPPPPAPTPCTPPQTPSSSENHHPHQGMESGGESSRLKQPSSIPVNRAPSPRTLKQPSPTKLRGASPHRSSGIPVRASQVERSQIPRPRSAIIPKSGIPAPASKGPAVSPRGSVKTRDDSWREGCY